MQKRILFSIVLAAISFVFSGNANAGVASNVSGQTRYYIPERPPTRYYIPEPELRRPLYPPTRYYIPEPELRRPLNPPTYYYQPPRCYPGYYYRYR